jgi:glycosyltransferase involved in cell wall biosynthesis
MDTETEPQPLSLTALVPVYNEELLVRESLVRLAAIRTHARVRHLTIVAVDDGSSDGSWAEMQAFAEAVRGAEKLTVHVVRHGKNRGKGAALETALAQAEGDVTVVHDADLEYDPQDLLRILEVFQHEDADAVFGSRFAASEWRRVLYFHHQLGNRLLTLACNLVTNLNLTDMETCYKAIRTEIFRSIPIESGSFTIEPELTIKLARRSARIFEVPIRYAGRTYDEGKKITWRDGFRAVFAILRFSLTDRLYKEDPHGSRILARMSQAWRYNRKVAETLKPFVGQRVIEIGAGIGNLTRALLPRKLYHATDINPDYLRLLGSTFGGLPYVRVVACDVERPETFPRPDPPFDTAICLNVVEHVEHDVAALRNIRSALAPGGRALILVPNDPRLYSSLDEVLGHRRRYGREQLETCAREAGFEVERILAFNRLGWVAWIVNGKILGRRHFGLVQIWLLNAMSPFLGVLDQILPIPPLSHIAVLRNP